MVNKRREDVGANLRDEMHNGVSVSDWLGTAALAARCASVELEAARSDAGYLSESVLRAAADNAAQALDEIVTVMNRYGYAHGYGSVSFPSQVAS